MWYLGFTSKESKRRGWEGWEGTQVKWDQLFVGNCWTWWCIHRGSLHILIFIYFTFLIRNEQSISTTTTILQLWKKKGSNLGLFFSMWEYFPRISQEVHIFSLLLNVEKNLSENQENRGKASQFSCKRMLNNQHRDNIVRRNADVKLKSKYRKGWHGTERLRLTFPGTWT